MQESQPAASVTTLFVVAGNGFDAAMLSQHIGLEPTQIWKRKLDLPLNSLDFPTMEWRYQLFRKSQASLNMAILEMLVTLTGHEERIVSFCVQNRCSCSIICRFYGDPMTVELQIDSSTIERLANLHCAFSLSFDE